MGCCGSKDPAENSELGDGPDQSAFSDAGTTQKDTTTSKNANDMDKDFGDMRRGLTFDKTPQKSYDYPDGRSSKAAQVIAAETDIYNSKQSKIYMVISRF